MTLKHLSQIILILFCIMSAFGAVEPNNQVIIEDTCKTNLSICNEDKRDLTGSNDELESNLSNMTKDRNLYHDLYMNSTKNLTNQELIQIYNILNQTVNNYETQIENYENTINNYLIVNIAFSVILTFSVIFNWSLFRDIKNNVKITTKLENTIVSLEKKILNIINVKNEVNPTNKKSKKK